VDSEKMTSDVEAQRARVVARLEDHFAHDRLEMDEFERRVDLAERASAPAQLDELLADFPEEKQADKKKDALAVRETSSALAETENRALATTEPRGALVVAARQRSSVVAVFSQARKKGRWRPAAQMKVRSVFGDVKLDFREAEMAAGLTEVDATAVFGSVKIVVPPEILVDCDGTAVLGDFADIEPRKLPAGDESRPCLRVGGRAVFGSVEVVVKPRVD
jgi:hypothetical protein